MSRLQPLSTFLTVALSVTSTLAAIGPVADLVISNVDVSPDGFTRSAVVAGGTTTGPLISGNTGDNFQINVINNLDDDTMLQSTSVHWHGLFQSGTNWADGPSFVNQCPIAKNNTFLYNFNTTGQAGTFWYHSHLSTQYCDGLRGPLVIYDPSDPYLSEYDVDDETTIITLADWYHTPAKSNTAFPTSDATLINGIGRYSGGPTTNLSVISVESGKRYRFRLLSMSCDPNFTFSIDGHTSLTVIEADGISTEPVVVDSIQIYAGQRYSFILTADQDVDNYWVRALPNNGVTSFDGGLNSAILRYVGADDTDPTTTADTSTAALVETDLHPLTDVAAPGTAGVGNADVTLNLAVAFDSSLQFTVNGVTFVAPTVPVLLQLLSGAQTASSLLPSGSVFTLPANSTVELSIPGGVAAGGHPIHLHGHSFSVVRSAGNDTYNYDNPVRRDTVNMGTDTTDNVTIRFETNNPGPWFLHCHIDWHLEAGFAVVFAEDTDDWASANPVPDAWSELCPIYDALSTDDL